MFSSLTAEQFIVTLVVSQRKRGVFLSYDDYQIIQRWLQCCPDIDFLILLLADILPELFERNPRASLKSIDRMVMTKITRHAINRGGLH